MSQTYRTSATLSLLPVGTSFTDRRTTITTSSSDSLNEDHEFHNSSTTPPESSDVQRFITRGPLSPGRNTLSKSTDNLFSGLSTLSKSVDNVNRIVPSSSSNGVLSFQTSRDRDFLRDLNEKFTSYMEKVRFLQAQNRKLVKELDELKNQRGSETKAVKLKYGTELGEARMVIGELCKERGQLQVRVGKIEEELDDGRRRLDEAKKWRSLDRDVINKLNQQVSDLEAEIRMLRRSNDSLDTERQRDKLNINRLNEELEKLRMDLSNETIQRLDAENRAQTLAEELEFLKTLHEQELKELAALAYRDTTAENREFWKNELSQAIRDIQNEYDSKMDTIRGEMETFYNLKVQEFRTGATKQNMEVTHAREETKKLQKMLNDFKIRMADLEARNAQLEKQYQEVLREIEQKESEHTLEVNQLKEEMNKLRAEMEAMLVELQSLMDAKLSLELEIAAYRKLLEAEENRSGTEPPSGLSKYLAGTSLN